MENCRLKLGAINTSTSTNTSTPVTINSTDITAINTTNTGNTIYKSALFSEKKVYTKEQYALMEIMDHIEQEYKKLLQEIK